MSVAERLDTLPFSRAHWQFVFALGLTWTVASADIAIVPFVLAPLREEWGLTTFQIGVVASAGLLGMVIGGIVGGHLGDRFGRRPVILWSVVAFALCTGLSGFAWDYPSLVVLRMIAGIPLASAFPVGGALATELSPTRHRGNLAFLLEIFYVSGAVLAAVASTFVIPAWGWRSALFLGTLPILYAPVLGRILPESPRHLASRGRHADAEVIVQGFEKRSGVRPLPASRPAAGGIAAQTGGFKLLWSRRYMRRTVLLWSLWFGLLFLFYGIYSWIPTMLVAKGYSMSAAFGASLIITLAQIPGCFLGGALIERLGRKWTMVGALLMSGVVGYFFGVSAGGPGLLIWGCLLSFFNIAAWVVIYVYAPELYPTHIRGTGNGAAMTFGRIGGFSAPYVVGALLGGVQPNYSAAFGLLSAVIILAGLVGAFLGEETRGKSLEQISSP